MASSVDMKLLRATKFPPEFNQKVDMQKVNLQVMKKWIASRISEILGSEDDVVTELCFNLVEGSRYPDIKSMQIQLTGFLDKDTAPFCKELWKLFLSAQGSPQGVPKELLEAKKAELIQEKLTSENGKDAIEASEAAVAATTGGAEIDGEATGLSRIATEASGAAESDLFRRLVEAPTVAIVTDTSRKTDVAVVAAVHQPDQRLPTPETQPRALDRGLVQFLGVGVVADEGALGRLLHRDGLSELVDRHLVAEMCRFRVQQQQIFTSTQETQIFQLKKPITICRSGESPTVAQVPVFVVLPFTQSQSST
ncbi:hypothetical protein PG993_002006 [Apiospora rasikravindrae]|uniref:PWI domain-containing protein n=1 Tax=Apiospora rasikravindrae TaxID=990691 RepID=A0ABR1UG02_9PEZI